MSRVARLLVISERSLDESLRGRGGISVMVGLPRRLGFADPNGFAFLARRVTR